MYINNIMAHLTEVPLSEKIVASIYMRVPNTFHIILTKFSLFLMFETFT